MPDMTQAALDLLALAGPATARPWEGDDYGDYVWGPASQMVADGEVDDAANPWYALYNLCFGKLTGPQVAEIEEHPRYKECAASIEKIRRGHEPAVRMRGVGAKLPIDANRAYIVAAANGAEKLAERILQLEGAVRVVGAVLAGMPEPPMDGNALDRALRDIRDAVKVASS